MRLDSYLAQFWPEHSRSQWQKFLELGYVQVNDVVQKSSKYELAEDDEVTTQVPAEPDFKGGTLPIIYEDDDVLVINKPTGILTHAKGAVNEEFSVASFVKPRTTDGIDGNRPGIVHRLDRETSGVIIAAKTPEIKHHLQKQFQDRKAKKTYLAIVSGLPKNLEAKIELPIERNPKAPAQFRVGPNGKPATTVYKVLAHNDKYSVIELKPVTGRTHQLRVHMSYIGHPIVGDKVYRGAKSPLGRLCLHAKSLEITIGNGQRRAFDAPLPDDFTKFAHEIGYEA